MSYLKLKGISKSYGKAGKGRGGEEGVTFALRLVDLEVDLHRIMVVLGPSGCGKSTLLRVVAGLEVPDEGRVFLDGDDITDRSPRERNIAMVFQDYALYPHMTVERNLTFGLTVRGMGKREAVVRAKETAALLGISGLLGKKPGQLSGGERQRLALGRAIVKRPSLFLMDEPLSNVDALLRAKMRSEITRIIRDVGGTMMLVTHDQTEAMTMGEVLAVMREGAIEQVGTPREIYDTPRNIFIARFIGSPRMNLVEPGTGLHLLISKKLAGRLKGDSSEIVFGIRPEDIDMSGGKKAKGGFVGEVRYIEELGHESHVTAAAGDAEVTARMSADEAASLPATGKKIVLSLNDGEIHLFKKSTGERIEP